jgi:hypothetical protein
MTRDASPRSIRVSKAVRQPIVELRLLEQTAIDPVLDSARLDEVERSLDLRLPDDLLAVVASGCDAVRELGITLERIGSLVAEAHAAGCPPELVAIGRTEGPVYVCLSRQSGEGGVHEFDPEEKKVRRRTIADWLSDLVDARKRDLGTPDEDDEDADPEIADVEVAKADLDAFKPRLQAPPPSTGRRVRHAVFGEGEVLREIGCGAALKFEVRFAGGTKVLVARVVEDVV